MDLTPSDRLSLDSITVVAGTIDLERKLVSLERNRKRRRKKRQVLRKKLDLFQSTFEEELKGREIDKSLLAALQLTWEPESALPLLCELAFAQPFFPYDLKVQPKDFSKGLTSVAELLGLTDLDVERVLKAKKAALRSQKSLTWMKVTAMGIGGGALLGFGGWALAPIIGAALGSAAGLSGAAAISHGLALIGGGSLATGGMGVFGGTWLLAATGALVGGGSLGGGQLLLEMGAARAKVELAKLQTSFRALVLADQMELKKAQAVIRSLDEKRQQIEASLKEERSLNERNSKRIKDIEATLTAVETALGWIKKEQPA